MYVANLSINVKKKNYELNAPTHTLSIILLNQKGPVTFPSILIEFLLKSMHYSRIALKSACRP